MMRIDTLTVGQMQVNCYVLSSKTTKNAILLDPGDEYLRIKAYLDKHKLKPKFILHTHGHIDHIQADNEFNLPVYAHSADIELLKNPERNLSNFLSLPFKVKSDIKQLEDSQIINLDDLSLEVMHTPGHTPGGICLKSAQVVFTGDTLFAGSVGRTDFPGASYEQLMKSIQDKLLVLPDETVIYPGHGPSSTIGQEKRSNPYAGIR